ncbi:MAG: hypothetical protein U0872_14845 [Planctomycetaceae bacterium]
MHDVDAASIDAIKEFRLRNWARRHYVTAVLRGPHWHPIVLDEMKRRDREMAVDGMRPVGGDADEMKSQAS